MSTPMGQETAAPEPILEGANPLETGPRVETENVPERPTPGCCSNYRVPVWSTPLRARSTDYMVRMPVGWCPHY